MTASSSMSIGDPLESSLWDVVCTDSHWKSSPAPKTVRVVHVVNGEHYAGAERVQDLLATGLSEFDVQTTFVCVKPNRFAAMRRSQSTPLVNLPMRSRFDLRPAWRLAQHSARARLRSHSHTHAAGGAGGADCRTLGPRANGASRAWAYGC